MDWLDVLANRLPQKIQKIQNLQNIQNIQKK